MTLDELVSLSMACSFPKSSLIHLLPTNGCERDGAEATGTESACGGDNDLADLRGEPGVSAGPLET